MRTNSPVAKIIQAGAQHSIELGKLHFQSHSETFAEFASPDWVKSRQLDDYTIYWCEYLNSQPHAESTWVASIKRRLVGTVTLKPLADSNLVFTPRQANRYEGQKIACLRLLYVAPDYLSNGIGRQLMQHITGQMTSQNYTLGVLITHQANTRARKFYERHRWVVDECFTQQVADFFGEPLSMQRRVRYRINLSETKWVQCDPEISYGASRATGCPERFP